MSSDIYAIPDLSKKVRYNRKVQEDGAEMEEREVDIYESAECIRDDPTDFQSQDGGPHTQNHAPVQERPFRAAALCLGVLSLLVTAGIIILSICYMLVNTQIQTMVKQLGDQMAVNFTQLQSRYETLSNNHSQLQDELKKLNQIIEVNGCPEGWKRFGCSCYFKSTEVKSWYDSRKDCQDRGADLVIINSREEQEFVTKLNNNGESWIGLTSTWKNYGYTWEWVDRSPLTQTFGGTGQLEHPTEWKYAACCDQQGKWTQSRYYYSSRSDYHKNWICEK
ncbi:CD209 antigen-like protein E [Seriola aureovittata]|uniref:CD209 antigen-like protein E n=1 Tax=Seriola aureovittata TaxID=2871759 RepID=UPI0024BD67F4|nr:CD209 antigen-like protein E [Seriola aureovittata]